MKQMFFKGDVVEVLNTGQGVCCRQPPSSLCAPRVYKEGERFTVGKHARQHHLERFFDSDVEIIPVEVADGDVFWIPVKDVKILRRAWQENTGRQPVGDDVLVEVEFNSSKRDTDRAGDWLWGKGKEVYNIAKWRIAANVSSDGEQSEDVSNVVEDQYGFGKAADEIVNMPSKENEMQECDFKVGDIVKRSVWKDIYSNKPNNGEEWKISSVEYKEGEWLLRFEGDSCGNKWQADRFTLVSRAGGSLKIWCDTCEGSGEIDETLGGVGAFARCDVPCPDCKGEGWWKHEVASNTEVQKDEPKCAAQDLVNSPKHYAFFDGVEAIEIIASSMSVEAFRGYCMGNSLKYRLRVGKKDKVEQEIAKADKYGELFEKHKHLCKGEEK